MKSFSHSCVAIILLSTSAVLAQRVSIDSPHNYKRPVSQRTTQNQTALTVPSDERVVPLKLQNNVTSVHNYKRQGSVNFYREATVVMSAPVIGIEPQNPFLFQNHYKSHVKPALMEETVALKKEKPNVKNDTLSR
ncbi:hypothetical protein [Runella sp.]|jgi:hypothetical protein|uniref:hypothetical protein n=1 Tax=Runella sp. TaxID=1960881 RepID=UPI0026051EC3|nr:hypothetical protein [Runella sp.]